MGDRFGPGAAAADHAATVYRDTSRAEVEVAEAKIEPFVAPEPAHENWQSVRKHLIEDRKLPLKYIDRLHEMGDLYADAYKNAVFVCKNVDGKITGAELKGMFKNRDGKRWSGLAPGSTKDLGGFRIGSILKAKTIYLVESAIDAISLLKLKMDEGEREFSVISTAGHTPEPRSWFRDVSRKVRRIGAFDADEAGDAAARKIKRHSFERLRPQNGKDWNDELIASLRDKSQIDTTPSPNPETPSL